MRKQSKKRAAQNRQYKKLRAEYLEENQNCERCINTPAAEIHHKAGRNGERLLFVPHFMAVCRNCHLYIHANPMESYERGWLISK